MKHTKRKQNLTVYHPRQPVYPNAAEQGYFIRKLLDVITAIVSGMGLITAMLVLITLT